MSPDLIANLDLKGKIAVVVDVLRATSCMATGLAAGLDHIIPFDNVEDCQKMAQRGYIIAGERHGQKIPGMDIGNSPFEYLEKGKSGGKVATTTTNGTKSIHLSAEAEKIITGSFLNISAVKRYIINSGLPCVIVCAGWKGKVNLEDSLFAGNLIEELSEHYEPADDSAKIVLQAYQLIKSKNLYDVVKESEHAVRLAAFNIIQDIEFCSRKDEFDIVPFMENGKLVAVKA